MAPAWKIVMFSELAAGSSSGGSSLGSTALRVGWLTAKNACCTEKRPSSSHTLVLPGDGLQPEERAGADQPAGGDDQHRAPVEDVGERAAPEPEDDQRHQAEETGEADVRRGAGVGVDLGRDGDDGQLGADDGDDVGQPEPAEVLVAQGSGVGHQAPEVAHDPRT